MVYGLCRIMLRNREEAEDAAQQTFLSAHRTLVRGGSYHDPAAWLATIARNECRRRLGKRRPDVVPLNDSDAGGTPGPDSRVDLQEELEALYRALTELPLAQRQAIVLHEFYGLSYKEVAAALGRSGRAVESLLFKSRRTLNAQLRPLRDVAGALVLPATLRDSLANLISGFAGPSGTAAAGTGGIVAAKVAGVPATGKLLALLAAGATATGVAVERPHHPTPAAGRATPSAQAPDAHLKRPAPGTVAPRRGTISVAASGSPAAERPIRTALASSPAREAAQVKRNVDTPETGETIPRDARDGWSESRSSGEPRDHAEPEDAGSVEARSRATDPVAAQRTGEHAEESETETHTARHTAETHPREPQEQEQEDEPDAPDPVSAVDD